MPNATHIALRKWNKDSQNTDKFRILTKISDLGSPGHLKSFIGVYINFHIEGQWTVENNTGYCIVVSYRENTGHGCFPIATFFSSNYSNRPSGEIHARHEFAVPKNIHNLQLEIQSVYIKGNVLINDFGAIYRTKRTVSVTTHD